MEENKYIYPFDTFIKQIDELDKVDIPKGYIQINAQKNSKKSIKHKNSRKK